MVNVLIVEDSRISRESFERQLAASPDFIVLAAIENAANAEIACMRNKIDLVLMDVCTADDESGLEAAARIKKNYPRVKVIVMTSMPEHSFLQIVFHVVALLLPKGIFSISTVYHKLRICL